MSITQKADGRWAVVSYQGGKQVWKYFGRGLEAEAEARAYDAELKAAGKLRSYQPQAKAQSPTVTELANAYMESKRATMAADSKRALFHKLQSVILPAIGHLKAMRLTAAKLDQYVAKRIKTPLTVKAGSKNAPRLKTMRNSEGEVRFPKLTTIHRELSDVMAILNWSVERKLIAFNPVAKYKKPTRDDDVIAPPTPAEFKRIYAKAPEHLKRALVISYFTGLRPGNAELFGLTWRDVDLDRGTITITSAKKGGLRSRPVPIHEGFLRYLKKWDKADDGKGYLIHYRGDRVRSIKTAFRNALKSAKIKRRIRPYDVRHAFATSALASGADLKAVSEILGHSRPDTTMRVYQHVDAIQHKAAIDRLPDPDL